MATTIEELIIRRFTTALDEPENAGKTVYDLFTWSTRSAYVTDGTTGETGCDVEELECPEGYSQRAVDLIASNCLCREGVPNTGRETSLRQVVHRMVDFWVATLVDEGLVAEGEQAQILYDELAYMLLDRRFTPSSAQWSHTGLERAYGIADGPREIAADPRPPRLVSLDNEFMARVVRLDEDPDATYMLRRRETDGTDLEVSVAPTWNELCYGILRHGEPMPQFYDTFKEWDVCPFGEGGALKARGKRRRGAKDPDVPIFLETSSWGSASINVLRFYDPESDRFDVDGYRHAIGLIQLALEASIAGGQFPTEEHDRKAKQFRPTGLGISNLAGLLEAKNMPYDSPEARAVASALVGALTGWSYAASAIMARKVGPFAAFAANRRPMERVIRNQARVAGARNDAFEDLEVEPPLVDFDLLVSSGEEELGQALIESWMFAEELGERYGYRNMQVTSLADADAILAAAATAGAPLDPRGHVLMAAALTPLVSGAISAAVYLPSTATLKDFEEMAILAWQTGCKGIVLCREDSEPADA